MSFLTWLWSRALFIIVPITLYVFMGLCHSLAMLRRMERFILFPEIPPVEKALVAFSRDIPVVFANRSWSCSSSPVPRDTFASDWLRSGLVLASKMWGISLQRASRRGFSPWDEKIRGKCPLIPSLFLLFGTLFYSGMMFGAMASILWPWGKGQEKHRDMDPVLWHY